MLLFLSLSLSPPDRASPRLTALLRSVLLFDFCLVRAVIPIAAVCKPMKNKQSQNNEMIMELTVA